MTSDSHRTTPSTSSLVKPTALSSPSSCVRSRTDWAMVLPATNRMVKKTAPSMAATIVAISPICCAKPLNIAPSVSAFVSAGELANSASIAAAISVARLGSSTLT